MRRFFDGGRPPAEPPDRSRPPQVLLTRYAEPSLPGPSGDEEAWALGRRIGFSDAHLGDLLVPADLDGFRTDLTSVPSLFTWLVPRTGAHLPAALVHDALVLRGRPAYVSVAGHDVDRVTADRVFRDAMADTGTGVVRRWLAWSAVTLVTVYAPEGLRALAPPRRWALRVVVAATLLVVAWLGWCGSWDLLDRSAPLTVPLPWMGESSTAAELAGGAAAAVAVPAVLSRAWGRFRVAGLVLGVGLALLLHVTAVLLVLTAAYRLVERVATSRPSAARVLGGALVTGSVLATLAAVVLQRSE